jgi:methylthioribose-1-phosphate isomerase
LTKGRARVKLTSLIASLLKYIASIKGKFGFIGRSQYMHTIEWDDRNNHLRMIDQRLLPAEFKAVTLTDYLQVAEAIRNMTVRGAPAIGATAAFGLALAAQQSKASEPAALRADLELAARILEAARPTAINLRWAIKRVMTIINTTDRGVGELRQIALQEAQRIADEDVETNLRIARVGAPLIDNGDTIIHHCNTGSLATVDWGTALGVIRMAHDQGKNIHVLVDETRPRLQGARLTAWELDQYGISYEVISDNAAGHFLQTGQVNKVFFGGDRVAANGDVANKIGSYMLALAAQDNRVPVYSVVPTSTIDLTLASGKLIPIEERDPGEVLHLELDGKPVMPPNARARNPAFDVTPHRLLSAIITENGVIYPPFKSNLVRIFQKYA